MGQFAKGSESNSAQKMLLETLAGHFAWLEAAHPRKAHRATARKARQCVINRLRICNARHRLAA